MLYTSNIPSGWFDLQVKLSILIFPVLLVSEGEMNFNKQKIFTEMFTCGLLLNGVICLGYAVWRYVALNKFVFQYMDFSLFLHPSYYSMYIDLALVLIVNMLTLKSNEIRNWEKIYFYSSLIFLEFMLILLQSKTGLLVSVIVFSIIIIRYAIHTKRWSATGIFILCSIATYFFTYNCIITANRSRISVATQVLVNKPMDTHSTESTQVRYFVWQSAWNVIKANAIKGVGTGDAKDKLIEQYARDNHTGALQEKLNAHNEYIQVTVALGIAGLICLLSCLLAPLYKSIREKRFVYIMFILILMINFLTESMFETQSGTIFYGFFNSLLMFNFVI